MPLTISLVLHGAAIYAASRMSWLAIDAVEREQYHVVWLSEDIAPLVAPDELAPPESTQLEIRQPSVVNVVPETREPDDPIPTTTDPGPPRQRTYLRAEVDWEEERRQAVERARAQREREEGYITFSFDDLIEGGVSEGREEPGAPSNSVFDSATAWRAGMTYVDSSGATIEWVSDRCYKKSGGVGNIFAFPESVAAADIPMTACVRLIPRRDLFEHAKPEYLKVSP